MADVLAALPDEPPASSRSDLPVLQGGLLTTALTLGGLYYLAHTGSDFNPMGQYADYVFPIGALYIGLLAGCGYGIMSYLTGVRIRRGLLLTIVVLQLVAYVAAEYIAYLDLLHHFAAQVGRSIPTAAYSPLRFLNTSTTRPSRPPSRANTTRRPARRWGTGGTSLCCWRRSASSAAV